MDVDPERPYLMEDVEKRTRTRRVLGGEEGGGARKAYNGGDVRRRHGT